MKRRIASICILVLSLFVYPINGHANPSETIDVSASHAILIEQSTGRILFEKNAHEPKLIASITKIMTAIIAIESGLLEDSVKTSRRAIYTEGSSIYLEQGETMLLEDLVYGLMLRSGNDAAVAISEHVGGSLEGFVYLMNEKARWLGMTETEFANPHGLDHENHYSTAYDMALLMRYAMENETFKEVSKTNTYKAKSRTYAWQNKNKLLSMYPYCTGGKTGYTRNAGRTLITTAEKDGMQLIAVTINAPNDWQDHINMYEWAFDHYTMHQLFEKGPHEFNIEGIGERITGYVTENVSYPLSKEEYAYFGQPHHLLVQRNDKNILGQSIVSISPDETLTMTVYKHPENKSLIDHFLLTFRRVIGVGVDG